MITRHKSLYNHLIRHYARYDTKIAITVEVAVRIDYMLKGIAGGKMSASDLADMWPERHNLTAFSIFNGVTFLAASVTDEASAMVSKRLVELCLHMSGTFLYTGYEKVTPRHANALLLRLEQEEQSALLKQRDGYIVSTDGWEVLHERSVRVKAGPDWLSELN